MLHSTKAKRADEIDSQVHYLDSSEQGLLVLPLYTDVRPGGGGTMLCPGALPDIAMHLYNNPWGVSPNMIPRAEDPHFNREPEHWPIDDFIQKQAASSFVEATGNAGDVYFLHPLMAHSFANNALRELRVIQNPSVSLRQPFNFDRRDGSDYSIVELATRRYVGEERLRGWKIRAGRQRVLSGSEKDSKPQTS